MFATAIFCLWFGYKPRKPFTWCAITTDPSTSSDNWLLAIVTRGHQWSCFKEAGADPNRWYIVGCTHAVSTALVAYDLPCELYNRWLVTYLAVVVIAALHWSNRGNFTESKFDPVPVDSQGAAIMRLPARLTHPWPGKPRRSNFARGTHHFRVLNCHHLSLGWIFTFHLFAGCFWVAMVARKKNWATCDQQYSLVYFEEWQFYKVQKNNNHHAPVALSMAIDHVSKLWKNNWLMITCS